MNNKQLVMYSPIVSMVLLEGGNVLQLCKMWTYHTSEGQSAWGWLSVNIALMLWWNWYRVFAPDQRHARIATGLGICINWCLILTILHFGR